MSDNPGGAEAARRKREMAGVFDRAPLPTTGSTRVLTRSGGDLVLTTTVRYAFGVAARS
ncbi:hypothetical protein [Plantactinospora sp. ZYX-F-223]|uniref:hypothetical protein n=1 Tax=Plantactinospora sp. ZYX-F-223 TaxID=3144103 RepID=UPI0031FE360E